MSIINKLNESLTQGFLSQIKKAHFVGIGGSGMSAIAEILLRKKFKISGSDIKESHLIQSLRKLGAEIYIGHAAENLKDVDLVVVSTAIDGDNPEIIKATKENIIIAHRAQMLGELMRDQHAMAVAGTHGKTTTTSLLAYVLLQAELNPTYLIGGLLNNVGTNAKLGDGRYLVAEADESDASFLFLNPQIAIVTNIDSDHLWFYNDDFNKLTEAFIKFLHNLPETGIAILCVDDAVVRNIIPAVDRKKITYGFAADAEAKIVAYRQDELKTYFTLHYARKDLHMDFELNLPGKHNVLNATAVIVTALELGVDLEKLQQAFSTFKGAGRRFHIRGEYDFGHGKVLVVDDYGHHPREIAATLDAARAAWPTRRIVHAFQPQRYSRTKDLYQDFVKVLAQSDHLVLLDIYSAGEKPIEGISSDILCEEIANLAKTKPTYLSRDKKIAEILPEILHDGDILLMQGAGDISSMAIELVNR